MTHDLKAPAWMPIYDFTNALEEHSVFGANTDDEGFYIPVADAHDIVVAMAQRVRDTRVIKLREETPRGRFSRLTCSDPGLNVLGALPLGIVLAAAGAAVQVAIDGRLTWADWWPTLTHYAWTFVPPFLIVLALAATFYAVRARRDRRGQEYVTMLSLGVFAERVRHHLDTDHPKPLDAAEIDFMAFLSGALPPDVGVGWFRAAHAWMHRAIPGMPPMP